tara:strand:+ start:2725 stop:3963 length:1239 start_codon:yes stop_codon:yes gene_type:complete
MQHSDTIYGSVVLDDIQKDLRYSEAVRNTANIKALGLAILVYSGASHTREEHLIGTSILGSKFAEKLRIDGIDKKTLEAAAILHDIGHLPFSHAASRYFKEKFGLEQETNAEYMILQDSNKEIRDILRSHRLDPTEVADLIAFKDYVKKSNGKKQFLKQLIAGDMDIDRMDFLMRDSLRTAVYGQGFDYQRLLQCVFRDGDQMVFPYEAKTAIESFFSAYKNMYTAVYYNNRINALETMLTKAFFLKHETHFQDKGQGFILQTNEAELEKLLKDNKGNQIATKLAKLVFSGRAFPDIFNIPNDPLGKRKYRQIVKNLEGMTFEELETKLLKETNLNEGELFIINNYKAPKPENKNKHPDVFIERQGRILTIDKVIDPSLLDRNDRHQNIFRVLAEEHNKDKIISAMKKLNLL